ncbi:MAG TPA: ABC transporter permease [Vicinamibacterales bacterium]
MSWWSRIANVFRSARVEDDLEEELQFHRDERIREWLAEGRTRAEAAVEARRRFGNPMKWREDSRDVKLLPWLDSLVRDTRLGLRMLRKNTVVTSAAIVSLSLALGACVAAFSLVDALILRPLPARHPEQLVYLAFPTYSSERPEADTFNDPTFVRLREAAREQVDLFAMSTQVVRRAIFPDGGGEKEPLRTQYVSGDAFEKLGIDPRAGRLILPDDDKEPGASPVAVISHAYWMRRFGGDPAAVGRWFTMDDRQLQIVGVAEQRFTGIEPGRPTDAWITYAMYNPRAFGNYDFNWFRVLGRLRPSARVEQAQSVLSATFSTIRAERVPSLGPNRSPETVERFLRTPLYLRSAVNGPSPLRREFERSLWILMSIAALVVLIAGSNVANLFLARTAAREREMALRLSIGAGRARLIQQVLIESAIVAGAACALGLLFASIAGPAVVAMLAPPDDPVRLDLRLDWRAMAFAAALASITTAVFGIVPALRASDVSPIVALKAGGVRSGLRTGFMRPFVAMQVAFGLIVVFVGGLLVLSFARLSSVNPGFATSDVLLVSLESVRRLEANEQRDALLLVSDRLRSIPGVQSVSSAEFNPIGRAWTHYVRVPGTQHKNIEATMAPVTADYFETMRIPVVAGRAFVNRDMDPQSAAIVINETFAKLYFGEASPIGGRIEARFADLNSPEIHEVVGVVADTRYDLRKLAAPTLYIPFAQRTTGRLGTIHVRVSGNASSLALRLREEIRAASRLFRVTSVRPQSAVVNHTLIRERLLALLSGFFAIVGLVLAAVGLYGVLSYSVVQRTREIGIRLALGARQLGVVRIVLSEVGIAAFIGAGFGLAGGLYLSRFVRALLFEITPLDAWSLAIPIGTLLVAALLAATIPTLRAARVDPVIALRNE